MEALTPCTHCGASIPAGYLTCDRCTEHLRDTFEVGHREDTLADRLHALGWSVQWCGLHSDRWCALYRAHGGGSLSVAVNHHGHVLSVTHHGKVHAGRLADWLAGLAHVW
jgi:hypothetical protein